MFLLFKYMFVIFFKFIWLFFVYYKYYLNSCVNKENKIWLIHIFTGVIIIIIIIIILLLSIFDHFCVSVYFILNVSMKSKDVILVVILNYDTFEWYLLQQIIETNNNKTCNTDFGLLRFNMFMILFNVFIIKHW